MMDERDYQAQQDAGLDEWDLAIDDDSQPTNSYLVADWYEDDGAEDGGWPYATHHEKYLITGKLAQQVRDKLEVTDSSVPVFTEEVVTSGGYSEYTQENSYEHKLILGEGKSEMRISYGNDWSYVNGLNQLIEWLDSE